MDIPSVKKLYDIVGDLALSVTIGTAQEIEFPYIVLFVRGNDYLGGVVMARCDDFEGAVEEMDRQESLFELHSIGNNSRVTVIRVSYNKGLVEWNDLMPVVPIG